jgi:signal transduction histidine kinase
MATVTSLPGPRDADRYLRLSQFLDLHSRWMGSTDRDELAHRIRQTTGLLLETDDVGVAIVESASRRAATDASAATAREAGLVAKALRTSLPQLHGDGTRAVGVFPFSVAASTQGYLRVSLPRPLFEGVEVAFLRFVASLAGVLLAATPDSAARPSRRPADPGVRENESQARRYVAMAVHDLRNPLNVISGYGGLLADGTLGVLTDEQHEAVDAINRQLGSLLTVIDRLIDFDRLTHAESTVTPTRFVLRDLFEEIRERCFAPQEREISWPGPEANFDFSTDRRRLFSVVQNLVDNALKHTVSGEIAVTCSRRDGRLIVTVADQGPGLPAGVAAALADRHASKKLEERGMGLGLVTVASYVTALRGQLRIGSPDGYGTEIEISLPSLDLHAADTGG